MFPKIVGFPPRSSILIGFSIIFTIHFGVPLLLETPKYTFRPTKAFNKKHPNLIRSPEPNLGRIPIAQGRKTPPQGTWKKRKLRTMRMARKDFRARILGIVFGDGSHGMLWPPIYKCINMHLIYTYAYREPTTIIFRGYNPYFEGLKASFFMVLGVQGNIHIFHTYKYVYVYICIYL